MRKFLFASLVIFVSLVLSESCSEILYKCHSKHPPPRKQIPGSAYELNAFCDKALKFLECIENTKSECIDEPEFHERVDQVSPVVRNICNKSTGFYEDLGNNLPCIKFNLGGHQCLDDGENNDILQGFREIITKEGIMDMSDLDKNDRKCLDSLYLKTCLFAIIRNKCGAPARDVSLEVVQMFEALPAFKNPCGEGVMEKFPDILRIMESEVSDKRRR